MTRADAKGLSALERRIYQAILTFPHRIDHMETRSEENCRELARCIAGLVMSESGHIGDASARERNP